MSMMRLQLIRLINLFSSLFKTCDFLRWPLRTSLLSYWWSSTIIRNRDIEFFFYWRLMCHEFLLNGYGIWLLCFRSLFRRCSSKTASSSDDGSFDCFDWVRDKWRIEVHWFWNLFWLFHGSWFLNWRIFFEQNLPVVFILILLYLFTCFLVFLDLGFSLFFHWFLQMLKFIPIPFLSISCDFTS